MKGQKKRHSFMETILNVMVGYGIAVTAQTLIFPMFGMYIPLRDNFIIGGLFTIVSIVRSYYLRRVFNWLHIKGILK